MFKSHRGGVLLLVVTTLIWGTTFPLLKDAVTSFAPSALIATRFAIAALTFMPFCRQLNPQLIRDGVILGVILFAAYTTQVIGLEFTSANRAAFITSLNVILVPILASLLGQSLVRNVAIAAVIAFAGIGVMSWEGGSLNIGDFWVFGCALSYAIYILTLQTFTSRHNSVALTAMQLIVVAILGLIWAAPILVTQITAITANFGVLLYLGVIATALVTWTQAVAQRHVSATEAALLYTLEPVFAAIFSFWLLGESLGTQGLIGAAMVVAAMILSQIKR